MRNSTSPAPTHQMIPRIASMAFLASLTATTFLWLAPALADEDGGPPIIFPGDTQNVGGGYVVRDSSGNRTGTVQARPGGGYVTRDASGRRTGTVEPNGSGSGFILRDTSGRRTGTVEKR